MFIEDWEKVRRVNHLYNQRKRNKEIELKCQNEAPSQLPQEALCVLKSRGEKYSTYERKMEKVRQGVGICVILSRFSNEAKFLYPAELHRGPRNAKQ